MPRFLRDKDYLLQIQTDNLLEIIEGDYDILYFAEQAAQAEMTSYLIQRYDLNKVFVDLQVFDIANTYYGKSIVEYTAPTYVTGSTYSTNDRVVYNSRIYKALSGSTGQIPDTGSTWSFITGDKSLYTAVLPANEFNYYTKYNTNDIVWYNDKTYKALQNTVSVLPTLDTSIWSSSTSTYSFTGFYPENTTYWERRDSRNAELILYLIDMVLFHVHSRANPMNVPTLRYDRYKGNDFGNTGAIGWLKAVASGSITASLPEKSPQQGNSIRYGVNNIRDTNTF